MKLINSVDLGNFSYTKGVEGGALGGVPPVGTHKLVFKINGKIAYVKEFKVVHANKNPIKKVVISLKAKNGKPIENTITDTIPDSAKDFYMFLYYEGADPKKDKVSFDAYYKAENSNKMQLVDTIDLGNFPNKKGVIGGPLGGLPPVGIHKLVFKINGKVAYVKKIKVVHVNKTPIKKVVISLKAKNNKPIKSSITNKIPNGSKPFYMFIYYDGIDPKKDKLNMYWYYKPKKGKKYKQILSDTGHVHKRKGVFGGPISIEGGSFPAGDYKVVFKINGKIAYTKYFEILH